MKNLGNFTIDDLGRIIIPSELRSLLGWQTGSQLSMYYTDVGTAILQPAKVENGRICNICEDMDSSIAIWGFRICSKCAKHITELSRQRLGTSDLE